MGCRLEMEFVEVDVGIGPTAGNDVMACRYLRASVFTYSLAISSRGPKNSRLVRFGMQLKLIYGINGTIRTATVALETKRQSSGILPNREKINVHIPLLNAMSFQSNIPFKQFASFKFLS